LVHNRLFKTRFDFIPDINLQKKPGTISRLCEIFAIAFLVFFIGEEFTMFGFVREEYEKL